MSDAPDSAYEKFVGHNVIIRTVTMHLTGTLVAVHPQELELADASWVASSGRWAQALRTGKLSEVEPFPEGPVIVGRGALIDMALWTHLLPRETL